MKTDNLYSVLVNNYVVAAFDTLKMAMVNFQSAVEAFSGNEGAVSNEITLVDSLGNVFKTHKF